MDQTKSIRRLPWITALFTFLVGTALLLAFYFTLDWRIGFYGLIYFFLAAVANVIILIVVLTSMHKLDSAHRVRTWAGVGLMLVNILIGGLYLSIGLESMSIIRLTIQNQSSLPIENVTMTGCRNVVIGQLAPQEEETILLDIKTDCALKVHYELQGTSHTEIISGYLTPGMGGKMYRGIGNVSALP